MNDNNDINFDDISKRDELPPPIEEKWIVAFIQPNTLKKIYYYKKYKQIQDKELPFLRSISHIFFFLYTTVFYY